jgi:hypothetical protein
MGMMRSGISEAVLKVGLREVEGREEEEEEEGSSGSSMRKVGWLGGGEC